MRDYYFSVGAMFKNESHILKEWIEHYIHHGVDHIYLINDKSTDSFMEILKPYMKRNLITLFEADHSYYLGRQRDLYNKYFKPILNETHWLLMCDLDEFIWSSRDINLKNILKVCEHFSQIQIDSNIFGYNGYEQQPKYVVPYFTKRAKLCENGKHRNYKYIVNSHYQFTSLNVHHADFVNQDDKLKFFRLDYSGDREQPYFVLNHYITQSKDFWNNIKTPRGDSDHYIVRDIKLFDYHNSDSNEEEDLRLFEQNKKLYPDL